MKSEEKLTETINQAGKKRCEEPESSIFTTH